MILKKITLIALLLICSAANSSGQKASAKPDSEVFAKELEQRGVGRRASDIRLIPESTILIPREMMLANGKTQVLSIPLVIENHSSGAITSGLSHEWYGGIGPPTDLYAAARRERQSGSVWVTEPGYQVGELGTVAETVIQPGESKKIDVRLNWPGTGSEPHEPLIRDLKPGSHTIRFLLLFSTENAGGFRARRYVETPEIEVEIRGS
ncbi:MAG TPA: hypothetical protein VFD58_26515 [Blastocatellia bacterium]|nr:hypothetical protein [Blastocatellia bacterium]